MKTLAIVICALCASASVAAEPSGRSAIEGLIAALNNALSSDTPKQISAVFIDTDGGGIEMNRLSRLHRRIATASSRPLSETTAPRLVIQSIRFLTRDVALVDAAETQYGSVILVSRIPVLLVVQKVGAQWKVARISLKDAEFAKIEE